MGNRHSSNSKVHGQTQKVASTEPHQVPRQGKPSTKTNMVGFPTYQGQRTEGAAFKDEYIGKPKAEAPGPLRGQYGRHGVNSELQCEIPLDNDDTFTNFIRDAKHKISSISMSKSNVGREQTNTAPAPTPDEANGTANSNENQKDQFSEFIQLAKKKLRTTSSIRKNSSFKRG